MEPNTEIKPSEPKNKFLKEFSEKSEKPVYRKKRDLLEGYKYRNSFEVPINPYTKMVCTLYESTDRPGAFKSEQRIGYNKIVYDGNLLFVVAETLKELGDAIVPPDLRPKKEGSL